MMLIYLITHFQNLTSPMIRIKHRKQIQFVFISVYVMKNAILTFMTLCRLLCLSHVTFVTLLCLLHMTFVAI